VGEVKPLLERLGLGHRGLAAVDQRRVFALVVRHSPYFLVAAGTSPTRSYKRTSVLAAMTLAFSAPSANTESNRSGDSIHSRAASRTGVRYSTTMSARSTLRWPYILP